MAHCFLLMKKGETELTPLNVVDDEMREAFGAPEDEHNYLHGWKMKIGPSLANGRTFAELRELWSESDMQGSDIVQVINYLEQHYTVSCWRE